MSRELLVQGKNGHQEFCTIFQSLLIIHRNEICLGVRFLRCAKKGPVGSIESIREKLIFLQSHMHVLIRWNSHLHLKLQLLFLLWTRFSRNPAVLVLGLPMCAQKCKLAEVNVNIAVAAVSIGSLVGRSIKILRTADTLWTYRFSVSNSRSIAPQNGTWSNILNKSTKHFIVSGWRDTSGNWLQLHHVTRKWCVNICEKGDYNQLIVTRATDTLQKKKKKTPKLTNRAETNPYFIESESLSGNWNEYQVLSFASNFERGLSTAGEKLHPGVCAGDSFCMQFFSGGGKSVFKVRCKRQYPRIPPDT